MIAFVNDFIHHNSLINAFQRILLNYTLRMNNLSWQFSTLTVRLFQLKYSNKNNKQKCVNTFHDFPEKCF